ncbi:MAG TPA: CoA pyrophosphatase [Mesorhizobium sp.]|jgi:8-oxo-dGTP pyrophosphatase MutT (NUDIX family)|nr:CoA pyrophosphatase [Mesorhizobium sp.]
MPEIQAAPFSAEDFRARAARETGPFATAYYGDHRFDADADSYVAPASLRDAAVLVPVVDRPDAATLLLTQRHSSLRSHSGQIAFPGGRIDASDASPEEAALREAYEEVGLEPGRVEVVGRLPDYLTGSGYRVAPVLGVVRPSFELTLNPHEVEAAFEVPLAFLMDPANHGRQSRMWQDRERFFYAMPWRERFIWGVTAGIIRTLYERLYA